MPPQPPRRRWRILIACVLLFTIGAALPSLWDWAELYPAWNQILAHAGLGACVVAVVVALVWFFALAGFAGRVRLAALAAGLLAVGGLVAAVGEVDFNGDLRPILRYRWEASAQQLFDRFHAVDGDTLPPPFVEGIDLTVDPVNDSPRFRGPRGDGVVTPDELFATDWEKATPKILWRQPCGTGFSAFAVAGSAALTLEQRHDREAIVCYDRQTGNENWVYSHKAHFTDIFGDGPRSTPTVHTGRVYALGATGVLNCVDGATGNLLWTVDVLEGGRPTTWGTSGSPLILADLNLVVVAPGGRKAPSLAAYDLDSGSLRWQSGGPGGGYSTPIEATLAGRRQLVIFDAGGAAGFGVESGEELWRYKWRTFQDMNITQPLMIEGDRVFVSSEASNGCAMLQIARTGEGYEASVAWENKDMSSKFSNPVSVGGAIYGLSHGTLVCLDARTGKRHWRGKRYGHGQILAAGGTILILTEQGALALVTADTRAFAEVARMRVFDYKTWNTPALAGRRLFIRNAREMACVELPAR